MYIEITPDDYRVQFRYQALPDYGSEIIPFAKLKQDLIITLADDVADKTFADIAFAIAHDVAVILNDTERKVYARLSAYDDGNSYTFDALTDDGRGVWTVTNEDEWSYELIPIGGGGGTADHRQLSNRDAANQHPISAITGLQSALDGKQPSGDYALTEELDALADVVEGIEEKIPEQASSMNQLADKDFVNSSIQNVAAFYITKDAAGNPFATKAELDAATTYYSGGQVRVPTHNDYCVVLADETKTIEATGENPTTRYIFDNGVWGYQYIVNRSGLTAAQWSAVTSGITSTLVGKLGALPDAASLAAALLAKYVKPSSGIPESDLSSGVQTKLNASNADWEFIDEDDLPLNQLTTIDINLGAEYKKVLITFSRKYVNTNTGSITIKSSSSAVIAFDLAVNYAARDCFLRNVCGWLTCDTMYSNNTSVASNLQTTREKNANQTINGKISAFKVEIYKEVNTDCHYKIYGLR